MRISWSRAERVDPPAVSADPADERAACVESRGPARLEKPLIVWIVREGSEDETHVKRNTLACDKVRVGANWFRCVKMSPGTEMGDPLLAGAGTEVPRFVFVSVDRAVVKVLERRLSRVNLYRAMKETAEICYAAGFEACVTKLLELLDEFDRIAEKRKDLEKKAKTESTPEEEAETAKALADLEARFERAEAKRSTILDLELKPRPGP